ncbi:MAG: hypothetical protein RIR01_2083 [Bacteroidota bacterium]|jgi:hypothetical protein
MKGKTAKYYATHPDARKRHQEYQLEYQKSVEQVKRRVELNRENRRRGGYSDETGPHAGKDLSHHRNGKFTYESPSKNRGSKKNMPGDVRARGGKKK